MMPPLKGLRCLFTPFQVFRFNDHFRSHEDCQNIGNLDDIYDNDDNDHEVEEGKRKGGKDLYLCLFVFLR